MEVVRIIYMEETSHDWTAWRIIVTDAALRLCHIMFLSPVSVLVRFLNVVVFPLNESQSLARNCFVSVSNYVLVTPLIPA